MQKTNFQKLRVYQLSENLADTIWDVVLKWNFLAQATVGIQMVKAADSVGANRGRYRQRDTAGQL